MRLITETIAQRMKKLFKDLMASTSGTSKFSSAACLKAPAARMSQKPWIPIRIAGKASFGDRKMEMDPNAPITKKQIPKIRIFQATLPSILESRESPVFYSLAGSDVISSLHRHECLF
jgi:hypothetical protein